MDENNFMLVFFDTFSHGIKPEVQVDSIRFSQPVKIGLIRIIPFGIAIESEIDSEARLGVTNPQNFNVKFFAHNHADSPSFEKIGEMEFDERNGVNSISFPSMPLASMLAISGCFNMLSIAVFGIISPHAINAIKNTSNQSSQSLPLFTMTAPPGFGNNPLGMRAILGQSNALNLGSINNQITPQTMNTGQNNQAAAAQNILMTLTIAAGQQAAVDPQLSQVLTQTAADISQIKEDQHDDLTKTDQTLGLYEDGEIQEIDYEDVSSNEDLLFGMDDDTDYVTMESEQMIQEGEVAIQSVINGTTTTAIKKISTGFPDLDKRLMTERWRFLPKRIVSQGQLISELKVLPNSCKTLFEVELERLCREERESIGKKSFKDHSLIDSGSTVKVEPKYESQVESSVNEDVGNIVEDIPDSADRLINLVSIYGETNLNSEWVEDMEELPKTLAQGLAYLTYADMDTAEYIIESLITWVKVGLSMEAALQQSENMYILRHLKAGITMAGYVCSLNTNIASKVLSTEATGLNVQHALIDLLNQKLIATPLKLQLIRALDLSTRLKVGLDSFISVSRVVKDQPARTPYQRLVYFLIEKNINHYTARVSMGCSRLLSKIHLYEVLLNFEIIINRLKKTIIEKKEAIKLKYEANMLLREIIRYFIYARDLIANPRRSMPCSTIFDDATHRPHNPYPNLLCMMESTNILSSIDWILAQAAFSMCDTDDQDEVQSKTLTSAGLRLIWEFAQHHESLIHLLVAPNGITTVILKRLFGLSPDNGSTDAASDQSYHQEQWLDLGLEVAFKLEALRCIDELLAWSSRSGGLAGLADSPDLLEDAQLAGILLGLAKLTGERRGAAWIAQVITTDDNLAPILPLFEALEKKTLADDPAETDSKLESDSGNANEKTRVPLPHSICLHYLPNLLTAIVRHADNASYLGKYGARLAALGKDSINSPFAEARDWLQPLQDLPNSNSLNLECITHLTDNMKVTFAELDAAIVPPGLVTVLRLLKHQMVAHNTNRPHYLLDSDSDTTQDQYELPENNKVDYIRYKYAITEFFRNDGLSVLNKLIQQISDHHQLSWQCGIEPIDNRYPLLLCVAEPATAMVCAITQRLIQSRVNQFKDVTGLLPLFSCYTIFCSGLAIGQRISSTRYKSQIESIRHSIIDTILTYTQSQLPDEENEKAFDKSLWTCMLKELLNFTQSAPFAFASGLTLLIELLPLPLPILTNTLLRDEETAQIQSARTLWSAHILCVRQELKDLMLTIGCTSNYILITLLTRLINLITALGPSTALMMAQNSLETIIEVWERACKDMASHNEYVQSLKVNESGECLMEGNSAKDSNSKQNDENTAQDVPTSNNTLCSNTVNQTLLRTDSFLGIDAKIKLYPDSLELTRAWAMLKLILGVPMCKHAFLKLIGQQPISDNIDKEQTFETIFFRIVSELLEANKENHTATQENMIACLQLILDARVTMLATVQEPITIDEVIFEGSQESLTSSIRVLTNQEIVNGLPSNAQCLMLVGWLARHCVNPDQDMATIPGALRPLVILAGHDYGFRILLEVLDQQPGMFLSLIKRVNETFSADNPDCQVSLLTALSLLQTLVVKQDNCDEPNVYQLPSRTLNLSDSHVKQMLQWTGNKEANSAHPVAELHGLLKIVSEEEESLQILRDGMESLIELLSKSDLITGNTDGIEGTLGNMPTPYCLEQMYKCRGVWHRVREEERSLSDEFREWLGPVKVTEREPPELSRCDLENLAYVCCNGFNLHDELARGRQQDDEAIRHKRRRRGHDAIIHTGRTSKKFVAPMRGRGFGVRSNMMVVTNNGDRYDSFRSRPPNTSRPPSMHVDDFQKLQKDEKLDEEIMIRERNLRNLRGGRAGIRNINHGNRTFSGIQKSYENSSGDQSRMPPPSSSSSSSSRTRQIK